MGILQERILEWAVMASFRGPSQPRKRTGVSCIAGRFFTGRARVAKEQHMTPWLNNNYSFWFKTAEEKDVHSSPPV